MMMCTPEDAAAAKIAAAKRVVAAAECFGTAQGDAAKAWVAEALAGKADPSKLLGKQIDIFEGCIIGDDDGEKCKELDESLSRLELELNAGVRFGTADGAVDRASVRVRKAAAKFGDEQAAATDKWLLGAKASGAANPALLLQAQTAMFGECMLDEDGSSTRCQDLEDALNALQASLGIGGMVVGTRGVMASMSAQTSSNDEEPPPPDGFTWGITL